MALRASFSFLIFFLLRFLFVIVSHAVLIERLLKMQNIGK